MNWFVSLFLNRFVGNVLRHTLTAASGILIAKGLPGLEEGTVANLTDIGVGGAGMLLSLAWSWKHRKTALDTHPPSVKGLVPLFACILAIGAMTGCETVKNPEAIPVAVKEAVAAKAAADAGSTVGVADAVSTSKTVKDATAALKGDSADTAAQVSEIIESTKETAAVLAEGGATLAGSDNPAQYGAYVKAGATLAALGAAAVAWILRKRKTS